MQARGRLYVPGPTAATTLAGHRLNDPLFNVLTTGVTSPADLLDQAQLATTHSSLSGGGGRSRQPPGAGNPGAASARLGAGRLGALGVAAQADPLRSAHLDPPVPMRVS